MIHHIVQFRFRDDVPEATRLAARTAFKEGIEALPAVIDTIRSIHVGFNVNPAEQWDICLTSTFDTLVDAVAYGANPAHKAVAKELIQYIDQRACVDFEE